jgi:hypothetical protein
MSDYTLAVNWSGKDALADSDAAKVISGSEFNTEFTTVRTAVNSKANLNGDATEDFAINNGTVAGTLAITGVPTGPTQSAGNNTTRLATTAFVTTAASALNAAAYPIGSIFTTTVAYANSAAVVTAIGGTTWTSFGAGKVLIGLDSGDTDFDVVEETGGAKTDSHTLTVAEMPAHTHTNWAYQEAFNPIRTHESKAYADTNNPANSPPLADTGGGGAHTHDIVQPYIVVYFWKRTA